MIRGERVFYFQYPGWLTEHINNIIKQGAAEQLDGADFIVKEINRFLSSKKRQEMINGYRYYVGNHDILKRQQTVIGGDGELTEVTNIVNHKIVNNQYRKMVEQKANYLLGKQITVSVKDNKYSSILNTEVFDGAFDRTLLQLGVDALNCGIGWLYLCYDKDGLYFKRLQPWEIIPGWEDAEHTELSYAIRVYDVIKVERRNEKIIHKVEIFNKKGISKFVLEGGKLVPDGIDWQLPYFYANNKPMSWDKIPLVPFKYNAAEIPLLNNVKSLQDALNIMLSNFTNGMEENPRNSILVLKNYDGENLGEFRKNLATYGAVKVRTADGSQGGVDTLKIEVNSQNYSTIIDLLKKAIIENAMGYDAKDDRLGGNANQMNIQSMYSDIDLDANKMETEFRAALEKVMWFVGNIYNHKDEAVEFIFNRDVLINEGEAIENCVKSMGILSDETIVAQHPWVVDVEEELKRIKKQRESSLESYSFTKGSDVDGEADGEAE